MKNFVLITAILLTAFSSFGQQAGSASKNSYTPDNPELYKTIVRMDSIFFNAYNKCDMDLQKNIYADSLEFYHDKGGMMTSKEGILEATKKNICGKVTRTAVPGSIEVYPIAGFGAIEIGLHRFFNNQEPDAPQHDSKFIIIWKQTGEKWNITRVISLH